MREEAAHRKRSLYLYLTGAVLILMGLGTALYNLWPDIAFESGLVASADPYDPGFGSSVSEAGSRQPLRVMPDGNRVVVPRIGVDVEILEGDIDTALRNGVYRHVETAFPGEAGNVAIAGHRNRRQFALLHQLKRGDMVRLYWDGAVHEYAVEKVFDIAPEQNAVLRKGSTERLTLYTCTPRFLGDRRTVVTALPYRAER